MTDIGIDVSQSTAVEKNPEGAPKAMAMRVCLDLIHARML
jgi:hypothetical protein